MMFEIDSSIVNVIELENRVKQKVVSKGLLNEFEQYRSYMSSIWLHWNEMNSTYEIHEIPIVSHRPYIGGIVVFCKRVMRKLTRWLFRTYYQQETEFNRAAVLTIADMIKVQDRMISMLKKMEENK